MDFLRLNHHAYMINKLIDRLILFRCLIYQLFSLLKTVRNKLIMNFKSIEKMTFLIYVLQIKIITNSIRRLL